jgi:hypothetical protein
MMNGPPSREEIDAKLETARMSSEAFFARMDERCARMDARCDRMQADFEARCARMEADFQAGLHAMAAALTELMDRRLAALYRAMIITAITSTLTTILGVGAINATVFTGMLSAMSHGKELGAMAAAMQRQQLDHQAGYAQMMLKQKEDFAQLSAKLDARFEQERLERERSYEEGRKKDQAAERAHQQRMRALRAGK